MKKNKVNDEPFYRSVYASALARLEAGESVEAIYDDRGINISKNLSNVTGQRTFRRTLDLGCGLGQVAVSLSAKSETVIATDILEDALKVVSEVIKRKNVDNIYPVLLDAAHLPFRDNVFDLIICSGVLEWVATGKDFNLPTENVQLNMLKEASRVLTQKGVFWLGIENRYAYSYFLGCVDHHSGLRFITLLPRFIANAYSKLVKKQPYRNYLYNY
jgi:ubiquinone/menaquinone biosynthesis C-methylase UbiE